MSPKAGSIAAILTFAMTCVGLVLFVYLGSARERPVPEHRYGRYTFSLGEEILLQGRVTAVIAIETSLIAGKVRGQGIVPRMYVGEHYFHLRSKDSQHFLSMDDLSELGIRLSQDEPFVLADLVVEPWIDPVGDGPYPVAGNVVISSVERVQDLGWPSLLTDLATTFDQDRKLLETKLRLALGVLDPKAYNSVGTAVTATCRNDDLLVVFAHRACYEGPLEWYIEPVELMVVAFNADREGKATGKTVVGPELASVVHDDLRLTLLLPGDHLMAGRALTFRFSLENQGHKDYHAEAGPPFFDLVLHDASGREKGAWSWGRAFAEYVEQIRLGPGEARRESLTWDLSLIDPKTGAPGYPASGRCFISLVWRAKPLQTDGAEVWLNSSRPDLGLLFARTGGIAGFDEKLVLDSEGNATYTDLKTAKAASIILTPAEHWDLHIFLEQQGLMTISPEEFQPRSNVAEFFSYQLNASVAGEGKAIRWVDSWASRQSIPWPLHQIESRLASLMARVRSA